jgi:hypothetical protein
MATAPYRIAGAFALRVVAHRAHLRHATPVAVDLDALARWVRALCADAGLEPHALAVDDTGVALVAVARDPGAVPALAAWVPSLHARPLHTVGEYYAALVALAPSAP